MILTSLYSHYVHLSVRDGPSVGGCEYWGLGLVGHLGGGHPHAPQLFARKVLRTTSVASPFREFDTRQSRNSKDTPETRGPSCPFTGWAVQDFPYVHHPSYFLWPSLGCTDPVQGAPWDLLFCPYPPSSHLISFARTQLSVPSPGVMAFSWQIRDFATWEDPAPGIIIKLGQNRACFYSTA